MAKRIPAAAVIMVQRKAPALSPAFAARMPISIVRLLVTRMSVITMALSTVGENLKGVGQLGVPLRKKPYATRHPANVAESAMMNSHIAIFLAGTEKVGASMTAEWLECWLTVKSAWLTTPPSFNLLQLHPQQQKQVQPQRAHKMPIT